MAGEIRTRLHVDLSEFRRDIQLAMAQSAAAANRADESAKRVQAAERQITFAERAVDRVQAKIQSTIKQFAKAGLGTAVGNALESLNVDDDLTAGFGRVLGAGAAGFGFGGLQSAGIAVLTQGVAELWRAMRELENKNEQLNRRLTEIAKQSERAIAQFDERIESRMAATKGELFAEAMKMREELEELLYQTGQYVE